MRAATPFPSGAASTRSVLSAELQCRSAACYDAQEAAMPVLSGMAHAVLEGNVVVGCYAVCCTPRTVYAVLLCCLWHTPRGKGLVCAVG